MLILSPRRPPQGLGAGDIPKEDTVNEAPSRRGRRQPAPHDAINRVATRHAIKANLVSVGLSRLDRNGMRLPILLLEQSAFVTNMSRCCTELVAASAQTHEYPLLYLHNYI